MSAAPDKQLGPIAEEAKAPAKGVLLKTVQRLALDTLRRTALVEMGALLIILILIDQLFLNGDSYWHVAPHPFWLVLLFVATQYGSREGLVAAICCTVALYAPGLPEQRLTQDLYSYLLELAQRPLFWSSAAVLLGELRGRQIRERAQLQTDLANTTARAQMIAAAYESLQERASRLEVRIAGQLRTVVSMYRAARAVETMEPGQVLIGAIENVQAVISPLKCSIYLISGQQLEAGIQRGWERRERIKRVFKADSTLYQEIVVEGRVLCAADPDDELVLDGQGVLAAPLINTETGKVQGMIKIEDIGFPELSQSTVEIFKVMCEWVGAFYTNALLYRQANIDRAIDGTTQLYTGSFYPRIEAVLSAIAHRSGITLTALQINLSNASELGDQDQEILAKTLGQVAIAGLRDTDLAFGHIDGGADFTVILALSDAEHGAIVGMRLLESLRAALPTSLQHVQASITVETLVEAPTPTAQLAQISDDVEP